VTAALGGVAARMNRIPRLFVALAFACCGPTAAGCGHFLADVGQGPHDRVFDPAQYSALGQGEGKACFSTLFGIVPLGSPAVTWKAQRAAIAGLHGDAMINVREHRNYYWMGLYDRTCVTRYGTVIRVRSTR